MSQGERLDRLCLSIARSALLLTRPIQAERDNESKIELKIEHFRF